MFEVPERGLQPPEPVAAGICPACGEYVWVGDPVWLSRDRDVTLCLEHMDYSAAQLLGFGQVLAEG